MTSVGVRRAAIALAWVVATALAAAVAWWAVSVVGRGPSALETSVLSQADVAAAFADERAAAATTTPTTDPTPTPTQTPTPTATTDPIPPTGGEIARTWDVSGGQVSAACRGTEISLLGATPLDGWSMEVKHDGPQEVEVEFRRGEAETSLNARCVNGTPQMTLEDD
jgi:outer membrane protein TolC